MTDAVRKPWMQYAIVLMCNMNVLNFGICIGWLSPLQLAFQTNGSSPLGADVAPLTDEQISWVGSLPCLTMVMSPPIFGFCMNKYGRKVTSLIANVPNVLGYLLLILTSNLYVVYIGRLIQGFCCAGAIIITSVYVGETVEPRLKGLLGGMPGCFLRIGIILASALGAYATYVSLNAVALAFSITFILIYLYVPESPVYLVSVNRKDDALQSLIKLRGNDPKQLEEEINRIEHSIQVAKENSGKMTVKKFFTTRATIKAIIILIGLNCVQLMCGAYAIIRYSVSIIKDSGADVSPYLAAIFVGVVQLIFAMISSAIVDKVGRRSLLIITTSVLAITLSVLIVFLQLSTWDSLSSSMENLKIIPLVCIVIFIATHATGFGSVPFVIIPELFAPEARGTAASTSFMSQATFDFVVSKLFPTITAAIGLSGSLTIFATVCACGVFFFYFVMFETRGLEFESVYSKLTGLDEKWKKHDNKASQPLV